MANVFYRLRIRNSADTADDLTITSVRGGTNPYALSAPSGDGQSFDPLTGEVTTGAYTFQVIDAETGVNTRVLTGVLADANARQQLLSRKAFVETSSDGSAWAILVPGYATAVRLPSAIAAEIQVGQTRRIEATKTIFRDNSGYFDKVTTIIGGPVRGGWGPTRDYGGWRVRVQEINTTYNVVHLKLVSGFDPRREGKPFGNAIPTQVLRDITELSAPEQRRNFAWDGYQINDHFPGLVYRVQALDGTLLALKTPLGQPRNVLSSVGFNDRRGVTASPTAGFWLDWAPAGAISVGQELDLYLYAKAASDLNPVHIYDHPVDIREQLWIQHGEAYDASVLPALKELLGANLKLVLRITDPPKYGEFVRNVIYGPFGLATRIDTQGRQVLFSTRIKPSTVPGKTIALADLADPDGTIFDLDESTVANRVTLRTERYTQWVGVEGDVPPPDGVNVTPVTVTVENGDTATQGGKETTYTIPGTIATTGPGTGVDLEQFATGIGREVFDRFGRGAIASELNCLSNVDAVLGEEVQLNLPHLPNAVVGQTPVSQRGGIRIVQVVRRTETPHGPTLRVIDSGTTAQASLAPTLSIAVGADNRKTAVVTITNAAALAALGLLVRLEIGTGATQPASGALLTIADPATTSTVTTPSLDAGTRVWVRARSEKAGQRPSGWSAWVNTALVAINPVTGLAVSAEDAADRSKRLLTWAIGANAADMPVEVLTNKAGETPRTVALLPAGSTQYQLTGLDAATRTATVRHREQPPYGGTSADATISVVTAVGAPTLAAPTDPAVFAGSLGTDGIRIVDGTFGLEVTATEIPSGVEVQVAVGAGAFATVDTVPSVQGGRTRWTGTAPNDGKLRHFMARHTRDGATASAWTPEVSVQPWGITTPSELRVSNFREISRTATAVTVGWDVSGAAELLELWVFLSTPAQPIATDPWAALVGTPTARLTPATTSYEVTIPRQGLITYGRLMPIGVDGSAGASWDFTVQPGTAERLIQQAEIIATTANNVTVRVRVADPTPTSLITIVYAVVGCTATPVSGQTIAAALVTADITTTGYVDFTVTRGTGTSGRITFTATSTDRLSDSDSVDIPGSRTVGGGLPPSVTSFITFWTSAPITGTDAAGKVALARTGGGTAAAGAQVRVTFATAYAVAPYVMLTSGPGGGRPSVYINNVTTTYFEIGFAADVAYLGGPTDPVSQDVFYQVVG